MLAPPGAPPGTVLLVRVSNGREWRVAVPERTDEEGGFTVAGANLLPPRPPAEHTPSYGRPIGMRMPRLEELADEMAVEHVVELAKPAPSPLETMATMGGIIVVEPIVEQSENTLVHLGVEEPSQNEVAALAMPLNALALWGLLRVQRRLA